jgi:putative transposase
MIFPLVRELAAEGIPVAVTCRVLGFSRQGFYAWLAAPVSDRDLDEAYLINAAIDIHIRDPEFGYRFVADELVAAGHQVSERRVWRLCSQAGLFSVHGRRRGKHRRPGPPVHDDLVNRDFTADLPNRLWLSDITEHPTDEGKLYLCAVKDAYSGRIVGYSMDVRMTCELAVNAINSAVARRGGPSSVAGCVVHSDRGSQFRSRTFVGNLAGHRLIGSMGRVGAAGDNAAMESFFALLQKNVLNRHRWITRDQLRIAIITWIERTYHRRRRQRALGKLTPIEFETIHTAAHAA